jgi:hypothetical protein
MRSFTLLALLLAAAPAPAQAPPSADPVLERMKKDVFFLAGPECEGRGVETKGIHKAAAHIADSFKAAGVKPAMKDGSFFQPFTIFLGAKLGTPNTLAFVGPKDAKTALKYDDDFTVMGFSRTAAVSAPVVFAGYGITAPDLKYDDYDGLNAAGKWVVILRKMPRPGKTDDGRFDTTAKPNADSAYSPFAAKIANAAAHKVAGLIIVNDTFSAASGDALFPYAAHAAGTEQAAFPVIHMKREAFETLLASAGKKKLADIEKGIDETLKPASFEFADWKVDGTMTVNRNEITAKNVVGVIEGNGPLANETVVIGAHYDHLGDGRYGSMGGAKANGQTHFGADDNASGTTGLIELARRYGGKSREGRRIVLIAFSGEERGLLGSVHYCKNPLFPHESTVAMLNMDMIGRSKEVAGDWLELTKKDRLLVYGTGSADTFDALVTDKNKKYDFKLSKLPAGTGPSDHDSFYRKKIPVLFFYTGTHDNYHQPTDTPDRINVPAMRKVVDLVQDLTDTLTTVPTPPKYQVTRDPWTDPTSPHAATGTAKLTGPKLSLRPDYSYEGEGMRLEGVTDGGAAAKAGLKEGDVVIELNGKATKSVQGYMTALNGMKPGVAADVVILRGGKKMTLKVTPQ